MTFHGNQNCVGEPKRLDGSVCPFLTSIDADKGAFSYVIQAADAPAFVLGFEELQAHLQAVLHQPVGAHLRAAFTSLVTLVDPEGGERAHTLWPKASLKSSRGELSLKWEVLGCGSDLSPCGEALL